jgi:nitrogen fixation/metabolism regulation signal transduction histidine kinase
MPHRRSILFVDKSFQIRAALYVCAWLVVLSVIYPLIIHNLFNYFIQAVSTETTMISVPELESMRKKVLTLLIALQVLLLAGAFLTSLFVTHRIVGPLRKMMNMFEQAGRGDLAQRVKLREGDQFHELADTYNEMLSDIRNREERNVERMAAAISSIERVLQSQPVKDASGIKRELEEALETLKASQKSVTAD